MTLYFNSKLAKKIISREIIHDFTLENSCEIGDNIDFYTFKNRIPTLFLRGKITEIFEDFYADEYGLWMATCDIDGNNYPEKYKQTIGANPDDDALELIAKNCGYKSIDSMNHTLKMQARTKNEGLVPVKLIIWDI